METRPGENCHEITPKILEKLREYEQGRRPERITENKVTFFEDGQPIVWYSKAPDDNTIDLFDLMGFHPETGEELLPVDHEVVKAWTLSVNPPTEVLNPKEEDFFDSRTNKAKLWFWKNSTDGSYKFFDRDGYHAGDPLTLVTKDVLNDYKGQIKKAAEKAAQRAKANAQAAINARTAGDRCDALAANPTDLGKAPSVPGITWDDLQLNARDAVDACSTAVEQEPSALRFKYQLARAYQIIDYEKAFPLYKDLVEKQYPAAFDNYGWVLLKRGNYKNYAAAERYFRMGAQLGNADAMQTLAELMQKGKIRARYHGESIELMKRAAELGNPDAQKFMRNYSERHAQEEQGKRIMQQIFQGLIRIR